MQNGLINQFSGTQLVMALKFFASLQTCGAPKALIIFKIHVII